ncbi:MAG: BadF/BadG/BcrA/BcrD ATPase family protein, partial [Caldisericota bacterium]|nr:BadF/BadG/BcrA/BcrD ATPase family protein [Caldisericota bacterium]
MIVIGVDGGTTRTRAAVVSERGDVLGTGHAGPANFQICGMPTAMNSIRHAVSSALDAAHCTRRAVSHIVFGLSGMDLPLHRHRLDEGLTASFDDTPFDLVNDTWIMLRAGTDKGWGIALVCGGGANACARDEQGVWTTLRGLGYESGMRGGGLDLLRDVTHAAFMAHDGLAPTTMLEHILLDVTGAPDYEAL